jgi:hypothetical protein
MLLKIIESKEMKNSAALFLIVLLFSCGQNNSNKSGEILSKNKPTADLKTPDKALSSFWDWKVWSDNNSSKDCDTAKMEYFSSSLKKNILNKFIKGEEIQRKFHSSFKNAIDKVNIESDTRAVVYAKELPYLNANTIEQIKYVLTKKGDEWFIDDFLGLCWNCKGEGKVADDSQLFSISKTICKYCSGTGWKSRFFIYD